MALGYTKGTHPQPHTGRQVLQLRLQHWPRLQRIHGMRVRHTVGTRSVTSHSQVVQATFLAGRVRQHSTTSTERTRHFEEGLPHPTHGIRPRLRALRGDRRNLRRIGDRQCNAGVLHHHPTTGPSQLLRGTHLLK
jgi:hypothetical protein